MSLPALGCEEPAPDLPAGREWTESEQELWAELWSSPQATQWDDSFRVAVAAYVAHCSAILGGSAGAWQAQEFRHLGDKLGLTPAGLTALGWRIEDTAPGAAVPLLRGVPS